MRPSSSRLALLFSDAPSKFARPADIIVMGVGVHPSCFLAASSRHLPPRAKLTPGARPPLCAPRRAFLVQSRRRGSCGSRLSATQYYVFSLSRRLIGCAKGSARRLQSRRGNPRHSRAAPVAYAFRIDDLFHFFIMKPRMVIIKIYGLFLGCFFILVIVHDKEDFRVSTWFF
jgi:hypothetical protein